MSPRVIKDLDKLSFKQNPAYDLLPPLRIMQKRGVCCNGDLDFHCGLGQCENCGDVLPNTRIILECDCLSHTLV